MARPIPTQNNINTGRTQSDIHALVGIRTHDPSYQAVAHASEVIATANGKMLKYVNEILLDTQRP
jgi:hypothetical protein